MFVQRTWWSADRIGIELEITAYKAVALTN
jgi:hypothetical protein